MPRIHKTGLLKLFIATLLLVLCMNTMRASAIVCPDGSTRPDADAANCPPAPAPTGSDEFAGFGDVNKNDCKTTDRANCAITNYLILFINALSALAGVVIVASIVVAGIQYSSSGDDPAKIQAAKHRIANALFALFVLIFFYAFLQWVVPGGVI